MKYENVRILNFVKSLKIKKSQKFKHAKVTRSTVYHKIWYYIMIKRTETSRVVVSAKPFKRWINFV